MIIYEPRGKAREYSPLAANLYKGCGHGCVYCYAPAATFTPRDKFNQKTYIRPRPGVLDELAKDAKKLEGDDREILLSFTSDAYQPADVKFGITRKALAILVQHKLNPVILTKGGMRAARDYDILARAKCGKLAATLTTDDPDESIAWEPGAALPADRIRGLCEAKKAGIRTWVSFEPVFNPEAVFRMIDSTYEFVDLYKVGKLNYHPAAKTIDWAAFRDATIAKLVKMGKEYYIKEDLKAA